MITQQLNDELDKIWWELTEQLLITFDDLSKVPQQKENESRQEFYFRIKKFKRFLNCKKCIDTPRAIIKQECICIELICENTNKILSDERFNIITHRYMESDSFVTHNTEQQVDCAQCLKILSDQIKDVKWP